MEVGLGVASAIESLLQLARHIDYLRLNPSHRRQLKLLTQALIDRLSLIVCSTVSSPASVVALEEQLQSLLQTVQSIGKRQYGFGIDCILSCICATDVHSKLEDLERTLQALTTQVVVVDGIFHIAPRVAHDKVSLPPSKIGLDRSMPIMDFLKKSEGQLFRVIGIHGLPGLGKTTILNHIWKEVSLTFGARAFVHIGDGANDDTICKAQTRILGQLEYHVNTEFPSFEMGGGQLNDHLHKLKNGGKTLFLAVDDVIDAQDLNKLLPFRVGSDNLHASSCIVVTCRDYGVVQALLNKCHLQGNLEGQVFHFEPPCLQADESKKLFADSANMQYSDPCHQDLLNALVPLCGGLPLALTVLGNIFVDEGRRVKSEWWLVERNILTVRQDNQETSPVTKFLQLSFERLAPSRQEAFLDIVSTFYGWSWETVERIVDVDVMKELKNRSLVSAVDSIHMCNHGALRFGYNFDYCYGGAFDDKCVAMHDLAFRLGERILRNEDGICALTKDSTRDDYFERLGNVRNFLVCSKNFTLNDIKYFIATAQNMQILIICDHDKYKLWATFYRTSISNNSRPYGLRYLMIADCNSSEDILSQVLDANCPESSRFSACTSTIQEITLDGCEDLISLPAAHRLQLLERFRICNCHKFTGFWYVHEWKSLKELVLYDCELLSIIPIELGQLPNLKAIFVGGCNALTGFPSLMANEINGPSYLVIRDCSSLMTLGAIFAPLKILEIERVQISELELTDVSQLKKLEIIDCYNLMHLQLSRLVAIEELPPTTDIKVEGCPNFPPVRRASCSSANWHAASSSSKSFGAVGSFKKQSKV
ncbi:hypothetical protein GOP47_0015006 [Adiantum capillus-veneris]|uniref:NB-ARC domain-containing protein n=1 Tax=Adiantum capillus-veneris TaxID=13818 RepID=A0A9D4UMJ2_ADICA|nr:hypothetical protein GOP47_0015006 [Adiantum capillus-veneris]